MRRAGLITLAGLAGALLVAPAAVGAPAKPAPTDGARLAAEAAEGVKLLVTFRDRPGSAAAERRLSAIGAVSPILPEIGVWQLRPTSPATAVRRAERARGVATVEVARERDTDQLPRPKRPFELAPARLVQDPLYTQDRQWGLFRTGWTSALSIRPRPPIAILDAGLDISHPEWSNARRAVKRPFSAFKNGNGLRDWNEFGHGTHVAGIAAAPINGQGVVGVAPARRGAAEIIPAQIADRTGHSDDATLIKGIRHAVRSGAKVINISAGGPGRSRALGDTILWATDKGALVVSSVGNEGLGLNTLNYPAAYPRVLGVGAQCDGVRSPDCPKPFGPAAFSNRNESVDVIAPGVGVISSIPLGVKDGLVAPGYGVKDGTSMSTPFVSGVAALVMANNRTKLSPYQVRRHIQNTARDLAPRGRDDRSGHGVVNPAGAVTLPAPVDDVDEVNDDVKFVARRKSILERRPDRPVVAFADELEDRDDLYPVRLEAGDRVRIELTHKRGRLELYFWRPGTRTIRETGPANLQRNLVAHSGRRGTKTQVIEATIPRTGRYYVNVFARRGNDKYTLTVENDGSSSEPPALS